MKKNRLKHASRPAGRLAAAVLAATMAAGCASVPAGPNVHSVGGLRVVAPSTDWKALELPSAEVSFSSNAGRSDGSDKKLARRALVLPGQGGRTEAVVIVMTSEPVAVEGGGYVSRSMACHEDQLTAVRYAEPLPTRPKQPSCAWAWPRVPAANAPQVINKEVLASLAGQGVQPPGRFDAVTVNAMSDTGRIVVVQALLPADFKPGDTRPPKLAPAAGFPPGLASWADALGRATVSAVTSLSGQLVIPPGQFSDPSHVLRN